MIQITNTYIRKLDSLAGKVTFSPADAAGNNAQTQPVPDAHPRGIAGAG